MQKLHKFIYEKRATMTRAIGFGLVATPFAAGIFAMAFQHGIGSTLIGLAAVACILATFVAGFWLIENG